MSNIRMIQRDGFFWNAVVILNKLYLLRKLGQAGDCLRP